MIEACHQSSEVTPVSRLKERATLHRRPVNGFLHVHPLTLQEYASLKTQDSAGVTGKLTLTLKGPDGKTKDTRVTNTVTTAGKNAIADQLLAAPSLGKPTHMAVGTGTPSSTALGTELDRNALTSKTRSSNVVTMVGDWAAGDGTGAITEAGVFDASSSGNMHLSSSFSVINKGASDTLSISWTETIA